MKPRPKIDVLRSIFHQLWKFKARIYLHGMRIVSKTKSNYDHSSGKFNYNRYTKKIHVTILGSRRQDSISRLFKTTPIRDGLTYSHYTKEIIQAINFVKSKGTISPKNLGVFRNIQIGLPIKPIRTLSKCFNKTDVFVIEIASRISYEFEGDYFHHVAHDEPLGTNGLRIPGVEIITRVQSDDEIRNDMSIIKSLLEPKPVIFVTHFCSYPDGSRARLRDVVIEQANVLECASFDPSQMLMNYPLDQLVEQESVVSLFPQFGHEVLAGRYQLLILEQYLTYLDENRLIYLNQVLDSTPSRVDMLTAHGLGDSGFGLGFIYRYAIANGRIPGVNARKYFASKFLIYDDKKQMVGLEDIKTVFHENPEIFFENASNVFTNKRFPGSWDAQMRDFLISKLFTPTLEFEHILEQTKVELGLMKPFEAIHIRFSDSVFKASALDNAELTNFLHEFSLDLVRAYAPASDYLVLSDSQYFNTLAGEQGFKAREGVIAHSGYSELTDEETLGILIDFFLLSQSKTIHQISSYGGSGFSQLVSLVYEVPILRNDSLGEKLKVFFFGNLHP